jgi:carboxyl-terminal processing protease
MICAHKIWLPAILAAGFAFFAAPPAVGQSLDASQVAPTVARMLEQGHYTRQKLNEDLSRQFFESYLRLLDYNRLYLLQSDVEEFRQKYETSLGEHVLRGDVSPAHEMFGRFRDRVEARVEKNLDLVRQPFSFKSDRTVEINRQKADWPADEAEADRLWQNRIEAELLQEHLGKTRKESPEKILERRYNQILRNVREQEQDDVVQTFLTALAQTYDPHSDYMSPEDMENFRISMGLALVGVGAVLRSDEGYARVIEVVPGGPADLDGRLQVNDRIAAVAQGTKDFEDVVDMKLDKVVRKIRGKKGTTVRLLVLPSNATDPSKQSIIEIVRDEVKLKDQEAKAELIEMPAPDGGARLRIGWISLPSFYSDSGQPDKGTSARSTTEDVSRLLQRLTAEGIDGLIIDLRRDGGGSLEEAINLTGLFIPEGPVVQVKYANGHVSDSVDRSGRTLYNGPMVVLMNRLSASASEIFAAALQDYGRAVIVGDERSFGKGTVQQIVEVSRFLPFFSLSGSGAGALKMTVQKFYRVKGGSTQLKGVESDIVLPSLTDNPEIGEGALNNPLPYDEVAPKPITPSFSPPLAHLEELRARSAARVASEQEFQYIQEDMQRIRDRIEANQISLNKSSRKAELEADKKRKEARMAARKSRGPALAANAFEITLDNVDERELQPVAFERPPKTRAYDAEEESDPAEESGEDAKTPEHDAVRVESLRVMRDMIELTNPAKTARAGKPDRS